MSLYSAFSDFIFSCISSVAYTTAFGKVKGILLLRSIGKEGKGKRAEYISEEKKNPLCLPLYVYTKYSFLYAAQPLTAYLLFEHILIRAALILPFVRRNRKKRSSEMLYIFNFVSICTFIEFLNANVIHYVTNFSSISSILVIL